MYTIIADDLTGSSDTGILFSDSCNDPYVILDPLLPIQEELRDLPVMVLDTESRHLSSRDAYARVFSAMGLLSGRENDVIFKKIDSTLRGNIGAEIDAVMDFGKFDQAFVIPAAPENGRIVKDGYCYVRGMKLHESEFGRDPLSPVESSYVPQIVARQTNRKVGLITFSSIRKPSDQLLAEIRGQISEGNRIICLDSIHSNDIHLAVEAIQQTPGKSLFVGASGLGRAFSAAQCEPLSGPFGMEPRTLFIIGSPKETSNAQVRTLLKGNHNISELTIDVEQALEDGSAAVNDAVRYARDMQRNAGHLLVRCAQGVSSANPSSTRMKSKKIGSCLSELAKQMVAELGFRTIVMTGGETAFAVMKALDIHALRLKSEIVPGIPLCTATSPELPRLIHIITKAGGFGGENALEAVMQFVETDGVMSKGGLRDTTVHP